MAKKTELNFNLPAADDLFDADGLFTTQKERDEAKLKKIYEIPLDMIDSFPKHPFKVIDNEDMDALVDSIKERGVLTPATVRKKEDGRYELLSGHRRKRACEIAGLETLRCEVVEMDKDSAIIFMVDSNLQRTTILPSEKAFSYKMRLNAMKRQGQRNDLTSVPSAQKSQGKTSRELLGEQVGESQDNVRRYIRLTNLIPPILKMVDDGEIGLRPAVEISYLPRNFQEDLNVAMTYEQCTPTHAQAREIRKQFEAGTLTTEIIDNLMAEEKPNQVERFVLKKDKVEKYLPKGLPDNQREDYVYKALEYYGKARAKKAKDKDAR